VWTLSEGSDDVTLTPINTAEEGQPEVIDGATLALDAAVVAQKRTVTLKIILNTTGNPEFTVSHTVWIIGALALSGKSTTFADTVEAQTVRAIVDAPAESIVAITWDISASDPAGIIDLIAVPGDVTSINFKSADGSAGTATVRATMALKVRAADVAVPVGSTFAMALVDMRPPARFTGAWATSYIAACSSTVQTRFAALCARRGITIANDTAVLGSAQLACVFDAI
jgi:hypothetical protein